MTQFMNVLVCMSLPPLVMSVQSSPSSYYKQQEDIYYSPIKESDTLEDDGTLLDAFGQLAKEFLTQHVIPDTDAECRWDWRYLRCEPHCQCFLQPEWGDYHVGRACRSRHYEEDEEEGEEGEPNQFLWEGMETCHLPPDTPYANAIKTVVDGTRYSVGNAKRSVVRTKIWTKGMVQRANWNFGGWVDHAKHNLCSPPGESTQTDQESNTTRSKAARISVRRVFLKRARDLVCASENRIPIDSTEEEVQQQQYHVDELSSGDEDYIVADEHEVELDDDDVDVDGDISESSQEPISGKERDLVNSEDGTLSTPPVVSHNQSVSLP
eukprot:CAMPEP_0195508364 /NCGR_PEP_ID=MMETSP0794_2-20130614/1586_1 /TAXON_ID=515487 /ORGANISM="Stephanopyxis turris, Strain CCMP 815" /LENGTH=322 /DNA_ID=CAMNT_0040635307 /DNA_START=98 /DNA_END=1066 /DNA_ORIENTATION=+